MPMDTRVVIDGMCIDVHTGRNFPSSEVYPNHSPSKTSEVNQTITPYSKPHISGETIAGRYVVELRGYLLDESNPEMNQMQIRHETGTRFRTLALEPGPRGLAKCIAQLSESFNGNLDWLSYWWCETDIGFNKSYFDKHPKELKRIEKELARLTERRRSFSPS